MKPLVFPTSRIVPEEDPSERAVQEVYALATDLATEILSTSSLVRVMQLRERAAVCVLRLTEVEDLALHRSDVLCMEKKH